MPNDSSAIVQKVWNYAHVLKNAGVGYGDYVEQITYLLFLKLADEDWSGMDVDIKGAIYEGLLEKTASSSDKGAGQYFTPRPLIRAIVEVMQPAPGQLIGDPACGTGGFLLASHDYISGHSKLSKPQIKHLKTEALQGTDIVPGVVSLCAMNLYLHGIGSAANGDAPITEADSLARSSGTKFDMILANPPFGKKGGYTIVGDDGRITTEKQEYERDEFWATTSNKQLNFLQHIVSELKVGGRAAVVLPDNVLFEGGAGETIRRELLKRCNVHTLLRLPTGIFYAQGVKANVIFFDRKEASEKPWTKDLWIYDLRTNEHFTLKTNPLGDKDLEDFAKCYKAPTRARRKVNDRFKKFSYDEIVARDKANLDIFWLKDESLEDTENLAPPAELAAEIVESLEAALEEFRGVEESLANGGET
jgi:type I restriction enzyme M protein